MLTLASVFEGKTVLVTGGTGSFGQKFTEMVLEENPRAVRIFSRGEYLQWQMQRRFNDVRLNFLIGDVRDKDRLSRAMNGVDVVIHAAALKHVPACEYNPLEAIKTNIHGAMNVVDGAIDNGVGKVVAISTDKAVHPVNLYGVSKAAAEKLFVQGNSYTGPRETRFSCVRYGNVVGSRGSVVPIFREQFKEGQHLTITDMRMTRFWITLEEGVALVFHALRETRGGEIFIPKIKSACVTSIADALNPRPEMGWVPRVTGIRPGEKLHEVLITEDESRHAREFPEYYVIEPEFSFWSRNGDGGTTLPDGFVYSSETATRLSPVEIKELLQRAGV